MVRPSAVSFHLPAQEVFKSFGVIESVALMRGADGRPQGQAIVQYAATASAGQALKSMHGLKVAGFTIEVRRGTGGGWGGWVGGCGGGHQFGWFGGLV